MTNGAAGPIFFLMLKFQLGDPAQPTGNLLVYCLVQGENPIQSGDQVLACHVAVSFVGAQDSNFPVVIFPPISAADLNELEALAARDDRLDIVATEDYVAPSEDEREDYMRRRMEQLNELVLAYVELCRNRFEKQSPAPTQRRLSRPPAPPALPEPQIPDTEGRLIEELEKALSSPAEQSLKRELDRVLRNATRRFPQFDTDNLLRDVERGGRPLAELYLEKFRAIVAERYEEAATIQTRIQKLAGAR